MTNQEIEQTILDIESLVHFAINKYFPDFRCDEDVIQTGRIGLWKACINYDSAKSKFSTFAVRCIANKIRMEIRGREKLWKFGDIASLDEPLYFDNYGNAITLAHVIKDHCNDYCAIDYDISFLKDKLSERDVKVFKMSIAGFSTEEIGRAFGYTRTWAYRIISKAQKIAKEKMAYT